MPERVGRKRITKDLFILLALGALVFSLARPQKPGAEGERGDNRGIEAIICVDVSNSMLSLDILPNRISFANRAISRLVDRMPTDKIGLVVFAANAYVQLPITTDLSAAHEFLSDIHPRMLSAQGTNIGEAIRLAQASFSDRKDIGKAIIIFTDVEDHEVGAVDAATIAKEMGVKVFVVGVGTERGGLIPTENGFLKDDQGEVVMTRLNPSIGQALAESGGGSFISSSKESELLEVLTKELSKLPKSHTGSIDRSGYIELYPPWTVAALILLILELFISQRRNRLWEKYNIFKNG